MPASVTKGRRAMGLAAALLGWASLGCGGSAGPAIKIPDGSIVYVDATFDSQTDAAGRDAALVSCTLERTTGPSVFGCQADWSCPGVGLYTFFCGPVDGGAATCYCQTTGGVVTTHSTVCATDGGDFTTEARRLCGWSFAITSRDGGGQ
jgi:hypothetical protein